jgi:hypothetical protein
VAGISALAADAERPAGAGDAARARRPADAALAAGAEFARLTISGRATGSERGRPATKTNGNRSQPDDD